MSIVRLKKKDDLNKVLFLFWRGLRNSEGLNRLKQLKKLSVSDFLIRKATCLYVTSLTSLYSIKSVKSLLTTFIMTC